MAKGFLKPASAQVALIQQMPWLAAGECEAEAPLIRLENWVAKKCVAPPSMVQSGGPVALFKVLTKGVGQCEF